MFQLQNRPFLALKQTRRLELFRSQGWMEVAKFRPIAKGRATPKIIRPMHKAAALCADRVTLVLTLEKTLSVNVPSLVLPHLSWESASWMSRPLQPQI
jgi:hypothetical protein